MDVSRSVLIQRHRFEQNIVVVIVHLFGKVNDLVDASINFECVWIHLLANLALELLPVVARHVFAVLFD